MLSDTGQASAPATLRVVVGPTIPLDRALAPVAVLSRAAPEVGVAVERSADAEWRVAAARADVALVRGPVHAPTLVWAVASREPRVALVVAAHPLAQAGHAKVSDLAGIEILEPSDDALGLGQRIGAVEELLTRVAAGRAIAVVPRDLSTGVPEPLVAVPLPNAIPSTIVVAQRTEPGAGAAAAAYVDAVLHRNGNGGRP
jgi:DNA-binding transcriptional LysR family regulator